MMTDQASDESAWILDSLFLGPQRRHRRLGSLALGLGGSFVFAIASCAAVGFFVYWVEYIRPPNTFVGAIAGLLTFLFASGSFFTSLLTLHLFASCQLPLAVRLVMIYVTIYVCWTAVIWSTGESVSSVEVLSTVPLCFGGFLLRWRRGWRALGWNQPIVRSKMTIFSLLDATTAIAITLGMMSLEDKFLDPRGMACFIPGLFVMVGIGLHVWTRLASLCPLRHQAGTGFGIWMSVNVLWAFLVFVSFAVSFSSSTAGLLGFVAAPGSLLVAHIWTEIPLQWLRGCGWIFIRIPDADGNTEYVSA